MTTRIQEAAHRYATSFSRADRSRNLAHSSRATTSAALHIHFTTASTFSRFTTLVSGNWLYGRTSRGGKFMTLAHNPWCAFEVDEVRDMFDWDSVVVKGHLELLDPELASGDAYEEGLKLMSALVPGTFTDLDPTPQRLVLFRVHMSELTGRSARPAR